MLTNRKLKRISASTAILVSKIFIRQTFMRQQPVDSKAQLSSNFTDDAEARRMRALETLNILDTPREELFDRHTRLIQRLTGAPIACFSLVDTQRVWYKSTQGVELNETPRGQSFCDYVISQHNQERNLFIIGDTLSNPNADTTFAPLQSNHPAPRFYAGVAIRDKDGYGIGVLSLMDYEPRQLSDHEADILQHIAELVEYDIRLAQQATMDPLTSLSNMRGFQNAACHILALCDRSQCEATLLCFDLSNLAAINSTHGHEAGNLALNAFGKLLHDTFRACDVISRIESSHFAVLLSHGDNVDILMPIRRFLQKLAEFNAAVQSPQMIRANISYLHYQQDSHKSITELLAARDQHTQVSNDDIMNTSPVFEPLPY